MANSLQDQLRNSGLASAKQARNASAEKRKEKRRQRAGLPDEDAARRAAIEQQNAEKAARDRELNAARDAESRAKALAVQIRELIALNRIDDHGPDPIRHHFEADGRVQRLYMSDEAHRALVAARLAIVRDGDGFALVPVAVADKIAERDASAVVVRNDTTNETPDEVDPYAEYKIPDVLMW